jgi:hypothetical protein
VVLVDLTTCDLALLCGFSFSFFRFCVFFSISHVVKPQLTKPKDIRGVATKVLLIVVLSKMSMEPDSEARLLWLRLFADCKVGMGRVALYVAVSGLPVLIMFVLVLVKRKFLGCLFHLCQKGFCCNVSRSCCSRFDSRDQAFGKHVRELDCCVFLLALSTFWLGAFAGERALLLRTWFFHLFACMLFCCPFSFLFDCKQQGYSGLYCCFCLVNVGGRFGGELVLCCFLFCSLCIEQVWLVGGPYSVHAGASGVIMGFFAALVLRVLFERSLVSLFWAAFVAIFYGSLFYILIPSAAYSWQGHLFGFL